MPTRPSTLPLWCTKNPSNMSAPSQAQVETGWVAGERPTAEVWNQTANLVGRWVQYLDQSSSTAVLASTLDPSVRLLGGGIWAWSLANNQLSWSQAAYIAYPGVSDATNTIAAGNCSLPAGYVAYVTANEPFTTVATTTQNSTTLTNVAYPDVIQVGWSVTGAGIQDGSTVLAVDVDDASITITGDALATASGVSLTFSGSGPLTVQTASMASFTPAQNSVVIARATDQTVYVGAGTGQMRLHDGEAKGLLEGGYLDIRRMPAGQALAKNQFVYVSPGASDSTTAGNAYLADAQSPGRASVVGLNVTAQQSGSTAQVVSAGITSGWSNLKPGTVYYLDPANLGAATATKPTTAGQIVVPVGTAITATTLLLNPNAAADAAQIPSNLTLPGTLTANSVVSAQGFRQQVTMGSLYIQQNFSFKNAQQVEVGRRMQRVAPVAGQNAVNSVDRIWTPGNAGSILNLQFTATININQPLHVQLYVLRVNGAEERVGGNLSNSFYAVGNSFGMWLPFNKGQISFGNQDAVLVSISYSNPVSSDVAIDCDMTVEMGA